MPTMNYILTVLLAVLSVTEGFPLGYYDPQDWVSIYPQLNETLVDFCFFNDSQWKSDPKAEDAMWCELLIGPPEEWDLFPDPLLRPLTVRYTQHVVNEITDQKQILGCFVKNRFSEHLAECEKMPFDNVIGNTEAIRKSRASNYFDLLSKVSAQIDYCWQLIWEPLWLQSTGPEESQCNLFNEILMGEHCAEYHPTKLMPSLGACEMLRYPPTVPPTKIRSIAIYIEWANKTAMNMQGQLPFDEVPTELKLYRSRLNKCYNTNEWLNDPLHWCHTIAQPEADVNYCKIDRMLQAEWKRVTSQLIRDDCATPYHAHQRNNKKSICFVEKSANKKLA